MTVLLSGGHLTPALAFIDYLKTTHPAVQIVFIGREFSRDRDKQPSREREEVELRGVSFYALTAPKLQTAVGLAALKHVTGFISAVLSTLKVIAQKKPDVFVSFGGYLALPIAVACWLQRIPVITHEQTRAVGLSNQIIGKLAKRIAVSHQESVKFFDASKTVITGNLIRKQLLQKNPEKPAWFTGNSELPLLYITGGSQGSEVINSTISQMLPRILRDWQVIHQCGTASTLRSYKVELEQKRHQLSKAHQARYFIQEWITEQELAWIYKNATAVISRAGANTTQELTVHALPAVLIPLPFSRNQEQDLNAEALAATGGAIIIYQKQLTPEKLQEALEVLRSRNNACRKKLRTLELKQNADEALFKVVAEVVPAYREKET